MVRTGDMLGYARVSTSEQDAGAQHERLQAAGALRVFEDVISGRTFDRPGLSELLDHARPGDSLCVVRLDRLGRSLKELLEIVDKLRARQVNLISLEEKIDTTSAAGELVFHVFGAIAHFERRLISERTWDGLIAARKRGRKPGRPRTDKDTTDAALKLIDAGLSAGQVAKRLGIGRSTLYRIAGTRGNEPVSSSSVHVYRNSDNKP
jgi:DNA invertase Pin-like site-specific DNA recombinase